MTQVFLLRNQHGYFFNRQGEWVSGREAASLFRAHHKDEAINEVFEISARDFGQRIEIVELPVSEKGVPQVPAEWIVEPPVVVEEEAAVEGDASTSQASPQASESDANPPQDGGADVHMDFFRAESA
ncbi:hypothetical protein [Halioxenophilus sp. WMMB6]|uniref:hypothetical protein n=1 Tax=Halioxenophilus sp. WMMB6 TaxID=3073815 RepID=UPI00295F4680|nr:hypothetical protein [Halioxenophilus sp. WMMB6]